jgi:D-inositol-3-phosphate glycosyltransferase
MAKILGTMNQFHITDADGNFTGEHLGVKVACIEFEKHLITHGGFDCCHFLLGRADYSDEAIASYIRSQGWDPQKILIFDGAVPLDRIKKISYHALHKFDIFLNELLALRHTLGHPLAPITGMTHTMSYSFLMPLWMQFLLGHILPCDAIVCTSKAVREMLQNTLELLSDRLSARLSARIPAFRGLLEVIPLGVDLEYWTPEDNKAEAKRHLELPDRSCLILCPGRFSTHDKMDLRPLLLVVRRLLAMLGPDFFKVVLVGDDLRMKDGESKQIQAFVEKLGLTQVVRIDTDGTPSRMRQYYRAADIFVSLVDNLQETFGLTVIQAMACGLPTVVSDWNGYKETVVHGETGFRVRTYWTECDGQISTLQRAWIVDHLLLAQSVAIDVDEMLESLYILTVNAEVRRRFGQAGRKRAEELYAWPVVIRQYRKLWDECQERFHHIDLPEWTREDHESILSPAYFRQFAHYASEIISSDTQLVPLSAGAELASVLNPALEVLLPTDMRPVFHPTVFQSLRSRLSDWPVTFGPLVQDISRETGHSRDLIARHVMWLLKYGVVKAVQAVPTVPPVSAERASTGETEMVVTR